MSAIKGYGVSTNTLLEIVILILEQKIACSFDLLRLHDLFGNTVAEEMTRRNFSPTSGKVYDVSKHHMPLSSVSIPTHTNLELLKLNNGSGNTIAHFLARTVPSKELPEEMQVPEILELKDSQGATVADAIGE